MDDKLFDLTASLNTYFSTNEDVKHAFMIICGFMMDIMVLIGFYRFALHGTTWRFPLAMFSFYGFRALIQVSNLSLLIF